MTITSNIEYPVSVGSFADAPSVIIVARNVRILGSVSRVDATIFASDSVSTCSEAGQRRADLPTPATPISVGGACDSQQLLVNGAVIARNIYTPRVVGGSRSTDPPAEIFLLRPEAFLDPYESNQSNVILKTDTEAELPPRN